MTEATIRSCGCCTRMLGVLGTPGISRLPPPPPLSPSQDDCHVLECRCISALLQCGSLTSETLQQLAGRLPQYLVADGTPVKQAFARFLNDRPHLFFVARARTSSDAAARVAPVTGKQGCCMGVCSMLGAAAGM